MTEIRDRPPTDQPGVILVTASSQAEAEAIAQTLVRQKLAACVALTPIQSIYIWQDELHHDQEWQLIIKTDLGQFEAIAQVVQQQHSYALPEIIALPIVAGSADYLSWMAAQVSPRADR